MGAWWRRQTPIWMGLGMAEYRAYTVGSDGHFVGYEPMVCESDSEAIEKAKRLVIGHDVELWSGDRFVVLISHKPEA
jgi:hypothetical protein